MGGENEMKENYRDVPEDRVLTFPATPGFKGWEAFFGVDSVTHPATSRAER